MNDKLQKALEQLIQYNVCMCEGGDNYDPLMADYHVQRAREILTEALAASKPEPQAQAGEPEVFIYAHELIENGGGIWIGCKDESVLRASHTEGETGDEIVALITLQSHREAMEVVYRDANEKAFSIAKKDAALKACVEALESASGNINPERGFADEVEVEIKAAITQADGAQG